MRNQQIPNPCGFNQVLCQTQAFVDGECRQFSKWSFSFVAFMVNFLLVSFTICHSFGSTGQSGWGKGLTGCFQVFDRYRRHRESINHALMNMLKEYLIPLRLWGSFGENRAPYGDQNMLVSGTQIELFQLACPSSIHSETIDYWHLI